MTLRWAAVVPRAELAKTIKQRDAAKGALRLALTAMGLDPAHAKIIPVADDEDNPFRIEVDGEDQTADILARMRGTPGGDPPPGGKKKVAAEIVELNRKHDRKINAANLQIGGLTKTVESLALLTPLRAALAAAGAVDTGDAGEYSDLVALLAPRLRVELAKTDDGELELDSRGAAQFKITPIDDKGEAVTDKQGEPVTIAKYVETFLATRPHLKINGRKAGPGAGGYGAGGGTAGGGANGKQVDPVEAARKAGAGMFGLAPRAG